MNSKARFEVAIVQGRLTHYRVALFENLRRILQADGVRLRLLHGEATPSEAAAHDEGHLPWAEHLPTRYLFDSRA